MELLYELIDEEVIKREIDKILEIYIGDDNNFHLVQDWLKKTLFNYHLLLLTLHKKLIIDVKNNQIIFNYINDDFSDDECVKTQNQISSNPFDNLEEEETFKLNRLDDTKQFYKKDEDELIETEIEPEDELPIDDEIFGIFPK